MLSLFIFFIFITCRHLTLIMFENSPEEVKTKYDLKYFNYMIKYIVAAIECLKAESIESAVVFCEKVPCILNQDGTLEKFDPNDRKTNWVFLVLNQNEELFCRNLDNNGNIIDDNVNINLAEEKKQLFQHLKKERIFYKKNYW